MNEYSVAVTRAGRKPGLDVTGARDDPKFAQVETELSEYGPAVSYDETTYTVRVALDAETAALAGIAAEGLVSNATEGAGLPRWPVVELNIVDGELFELKLNHSRPQSLRERKKRGQPRRRPT